MLFNMKRAALQSGNDKSAPNQAGADVAVSEVCLLIQVSEVKIALQRHTLLAENATLCTFRSETLSSYRGL